MVVTVLGDLVVSALLIAMGNRHFRDYRWVISCEQLNERVSKCVSDLALGYAIWHWITDRH